MSHSRGNEKQHRYARRKRFLQKKKQKEAQKSYGAAQKRKMCGSKVRYRNQSEALGVAIHRMKNGAPKLRTYKCPLCGGWHLTSKKLWSEQKRN